ncbi:DNA excision repair protein ERCC-2 [Pancytospora epiphaga]|nr:DNA excision repair protein ERCC-2 [Pancytospora epiphaga]
MRFEVDGVPIYFPYDNIYEEQHEYITTVVKILQGGGHALIEMPSGTGKTIALLSSCVSYQHYCRLSGKPFKIVYCARTVPEVEKTVEELRGLVDHINSCISDFQFLGLSLTSRTSLCINPYALGGNTDLICQRLISRLGEAKCDFYEASQFTLPFGVYSISDLRKIGVEKGVCPYYLSRNSIPRCDCIVYTYNYIIDPAVYNAVSKCIPADSVIIFDEAHNIDSHCIEALSMELNRSVLEAAGRMISMVGNSIKSKDSAHDLPKDLQIEQNVEDVIPYYELNSRNFEHCPGNLRRSVHFLSVMKRLVEFFKTKLKTTHLTTESIDTFAHHIEELTFIKRKSLQFCSQRLGMLVAEIDDDEIRKLKQVADFATMLGIHSRGFSVIFEPYENNVFNPTLRLCCLDASIAISHVFKHFKSVIITSGTLSPIEMYPRILNFVPGAIIEVGTTLSRNSISPIVITKGNDQMIMSGPGCAWYLEGESSDKPTDLTTSFSFRNDPSVIRNYGNLLISLSKTVPDNIVCFFPSYTYMEEIVTVWSETDVIKEIIRNKLLFIETPDGKETALALSKYREACDTGTGAMFLSVARGKVSEGVDFEHGYGRAVVMLGVPFMYTESIRLKVRLEYLRSNFGIKEYDFLVFDAMRHAAQCLGRVFRNKTDYGLMIMADSRFSRCTDKLPRWIKERIEPGHTGLSIEMAMHIAKAFYREMAQYLSVD